MNKTLATAIASVIAFILLVINTIAGTNFAIPEDVLSSIAVLLAGGVMWFISHWYNQDYTSVAKKMTPLMRKIKELERVGDLRLLDNIQRVIDEWEGEDNDN
jgi:hypothetical protein